MPNLTNRLGPMRPASDQPAADRAAMSSTAPFVSVAAFLTLIQGAPVSLADLAADAAARALWNNSMFLGQWTGPAAIPSVIILSAAQHLPRAATGPLHAVAHDNPTNFRDLGRALVPPVSPGSPASPTRAGPASREATRTSLHDALSPPSSHGPKPAPPPSLRSCAPRPASPRPPPAPTRHGLPLACAGSRT